MILLDTCVFLWLAADQSRLSARARQAIGEAGAGVHVSAITAWEIGWKESKGHLELGMGPRAWFALAMEVQQVVEAPVTSRVALGAAELPRLHRDPADRFIIATALDGGMAIVTPDAAIQAYPGVRVIW